MSDSDDPQKPYTTVIDLTRRAQRERQREEDLKEMREADHLAPVEQGSLPPRVEAAMSAAGWDSLMPVQEKTLPYLLEGTDLIVQSRTGSGKTGAFLLPLFEILDAEKDAAQALILTPTRELARQIHSEFERMTLATTEPAGMRAVLVYGGVKYGPQVKGLKEGAHVVIGTPGRILDHLNRGTFDLKELDYLIFDEADEMLSMGFYPDMRELKKYLPRDRHSYMFSATIPPKVRSMAREFLNEPQFISLSAGQESVETLEYRYYVVDRMEKDRLLVRLFELENPDSAIVFVNTKRDVEYLSKFLSNYGFNAVAMSGDLTQKAREEAMEQTKQGKIRYLIATDVAARGIDISDLSHVFMYDVPQDPEYLIHRSGRTARAGKAGVAIVLATVEDQANLLRAASHYGVQIEKRPVPTSDEVSTRIAERLTVVLENNLRERSNLQRERLQQFTPLVKELADEEPELLAMFLDDLYRKMLAKAEADKEADRDEAKEKQRRGRSSSES